VHRGGHGRAVAVAGQGRSDLPALALLPDGSYSPVLVNPQIRGKARKAVLEAARGGQDLDEDQARYVRVVDHEVPDRPGDGKGEVIALVTHDHRDDSSRSAAAGRGIPPKVGA
jgi:hypothetical protein